MKWLEQTAMDEFVEVTKNYPRYRYLYTSEDYEQTLVVDKDYMKNSLMYRGESSDCAVSKLSAVFWNKRGGQGRARLTTPSQASRRLA
jgi:hypothetical protein